MSQQFKSQAYGAQGAIHQSSVQGSQHFGGNYDNSWSKTESLGQGGVRTTNFSESQRTTSIPGGFSASTSYQSSSKSSSSHSTGLAQPLGLGLNASQRTAASYSSATQGAVGYGQGSGLGFGSATKSSFGKASLTASNYNFSAESGFSEGRVIAERELAPRLVSTREGKPVVIDVIERGDVIKGESVHEGQVRVVSERVQKTERKSEHRESRRNEVSVEKMRREKIIEIIKEKPVAKEVVRDVVYDVVIDVPIERTIEREKIIEVIMEKEIETVIEIPVEQIIEIPVERIIEKPVEIKKTVQREVERVVQKPYEVVRENLIFKEKVLEIEEGTHQNYPGAVVLPTEIRYEQRLNRVEKPVLVNNVIEKFTEVKQEKVIDIPKPRLVEKNIPFFHEKPVPREKIIEEHLLRHVGNDVIKNVEFIRETPRPTENVVEAMLKRERLVEHETQIPVQFLHEKPVFLENVIERPFEVIVEVPKSIDVMTPIYSEVFTQSEVQIEQFVGKPVEKVVRRTVPVIKQVKVPYNVNIEKTIQKPIEMIVEKKINKYIEVPVEKLIEKPIYIERIVERPKYVDKIVEVKVDIVRENIRTVEKIVDKPVSVDTVLEKQVEVIREKVVEVPVEKIVEVPIVVKIQKAKLAERNLEDFVNYETEVQDFSAGYIEVEEIVEVEDAQLASEIETRKREVARQETENRTLKTQFEALTREFSEFRSKGSAIDENENIRLKARLSDLNSALRTLSEQKKFLRAKSVSRSQVTETIVKKDPRIEPLRNHLRTLIAENNALIESMKASSQSVASQLQKSSHAASGSANQSYSQTRNVSQAGVSSILTQTSSSYSGVAQSSLSRF